jgi:AraC-like DNA-binding protein
MASLNERAARRLERSCDWMRTAPAAGGLERIEAFFSGHGFDPHRHDSYAIGYTIAGVQAFRYRGAAWRSLPGQVFVLHPDEVHDGRAGTRAGFRYRILYLEPRLIRDALDARTLPFVRDVVSNDRQLASAIMPALDDLDTPLEDLQRDAIILALAEALAERSPARRSLAPRDLRAVDTARAFLDAENGRAVTSAALEAATGVARHALARHFRACLGTSPYRYLVMRRLDRVRALIRKGAPLADAALRCGFADQSHMTRHFKRAYGLAPGRWVASQVTNASASGK